MTIQQAAMRKALEALQNVSGLDHSFASQKQHYEAIDALRTALAQQGEQPADYIVSAVVIKDTESGINTQNKLYPVLAVSPEEAEGKALALVTNDFPEHRLHTICHIAAAPAPQAQPSQYGSKELQDLILANLTAPQPVGINGLTEAETSASMSVRGLSEPAPQPAQAEMLAALKKYAFENQGTWIFPGWDGDRIVRHISALQSAQPVAPMTDSQLTGLYSRYAKYQEEGMEVSGWFDFARAIEQAHGIGVGK